MKTKKNVLFHNSFVSKATKGIVECIRYEEERAKARIGKLSLYSINEIEKKRVL